MSDVSIDGEEDEILIDFEDIFSFNDLVRGFSMVFFRFSSESHFERRRREEKTTQTF